MEFTYFKKTGEYYRDGEWDGDAGYKFTFKPTDAELKSELKELVVRDYGERAWDLVENLDLIKEVSADYKEELKEIFEDVAMKREND